MTIRHVFFDIDNTLMPTSKFLKRANENAVNAMIQRGLKCNLERGIKELKIILESKGPNYNRHFNDLVKKINGKVDLKIVAAGVMAYHNTKNELTTYPEVPNVLLKLHNAGYKLYIASEGIKIKQWDKLVRLGVDLFFDNVYVTKHKNTVFFRRIIRQAKLNPKECVMVGDNPDKDTGPALEVGMYAIRLRKGKYANLKGKATCTVANLKRLPEIIERFD